MTSEAFLKDRLTKNIYTLKLISFIGCAGSQATQISVIELAVGFVSFIKKVILMTVGTIICAVGTANMFESSTCGFGLTLTFIGVVLMEVTNWIIGGHWAEKNSDYQH
jgi:hypothetical protein